MRGETRLALCEQCRMVVALPGVCPTDPAHHLVDPSVQAELDGFVSRTIPFRDVLTTALEARRHASWNAFGAFGAVPPSFWPGILLLLLAVPFGWPAGTAGAAWTAVAAARAWRKYRTVNEEYAPTPQGVALPNPDVDATETFEGVCSGEARVHSAASGTECLAYGILVVAGDRSPWPPMLLYLAEAAADFTIRLYSGERIVAGPSRPFISSPVKERIRLVATATPILKALWPTTDWSTAAAAFRGTVREVLLQPGDQVLVNGDFARSSEQPQGPREVPDVQLTARGVWQVTVGPRSARSVP